jgi:pimeloyl-ACP methyl ester carboxylesterase
MRKQAPSNRSALQLSRRRMIAAAASASAGLAMNRQLSWAAQTPVGASAGDDVASLIDIGGRSLYLDCRGSGSPAVVLEAGFGNDGEIWDSVALPEDQSGPAVFPAVAMFTRVCAYDRPGTYRDPGFPGRSDPIRGTRTADDIVADLHALLTAANVPGPCVMVGHSFGGLIVRLYASMYPIDVAGLVLVDAAHEDYYDAVKSVLTPAQWEAYTNAPEPEGYPELEKIDIIASAEQMRNAAVASPLHPMPLVVITHGKPWEWPEEYPGDALEAVWLPQQLKLAALVPDGQLIVAEQSEHYIQLTQPDLVIDAIHQVVDTVRNPD